MGAPKLLDFKAPLGLRELGVLGLRLTINQEPEGMGTQALLIGS